MSVHTTGPRRIFVTASVFVSFWADLGDDMYGAEVTDDSLQEDIGEGLNELIATELDGVDAPITDLIITSTADVSSIKIPNREEATTQ